jgi:hypothetical protein
MTDQKSSSAILSPEFTPGRHHNVSAVGPASRRNFLTSSIGMAAGGAVVQWPPGSAMAQGAGTAQPDGELARLQGRRRILLKGGVVITLDRQVGDFAEADVLIEDGKISAVRPNIAASVDTAAVVDAANHIVVPGFVDTHSHSYQGILRGVMTNGTLERPTADVGAGGRPRCQGVWRRPRGRGACGAAYSER